MDNKAAGFFPKENLDKIEMLRRVDFLPNVDFLPKTVIPLQSQQIVKSECNFNEDHCLKLSDQIPKVEQIIKYDLFDKPLSFRNDAFDNAYLKEINALVENLEKSSRGMLSV